jgi:hypothetical protein
VAKSRPRNTDWPDQTQTAAPSTIRSYFTVNMKKPTGIFPAGSTLGGKEMYEHLTLLPLIVLIVTIKVKIITKKR